MPSEFLKAYGATLIGAVVGLTLVSFGMFGDNEIVLMSGLTTLGTALGIHLGGNTNLVPIKTADAVAHVEAQGATVKGKTKLLSPKVK